MKGGLVTVGLGASLITVIALHFLEPTLSITWSYAHLSRDEWRMGAAALLSLALPAFGAWLWALPVSTDPLRIPSGPMLAVVGGLALSGVALLGAVAPAPASHYDSIVLLDSVRGTRDAPMRWMLGAAALCLWGAD